jgi:adenine deaminase
MAILVREATGAKNVAAIVPLINKQNAKRFAFATDDRGPADLLHKGSIDNNLRIATRNGLDPITAIQMATLNAAEIFGLKDRGAISPGRRADIVVTSSIENFQATKVFSAGKLVAENGMMSEPLIRKHFQNSAMMSSINLHIDHLCLDIPSQNGKMRVIGILHNQLITEELIVTPLVKNGKVVSDTNNDILKLASIERHHNTGNVGLGFVKGMGLKDGAIAASIGHDCHNITVVGTKDADMLQAVNEIKKMNGGMIVVKNKDILAKLPLPVGGLMSDLDIDDLVSQHTNVINAAKSLGSPLDDPFMHLGFLPLEVIPKLKLTDKGLVDVEKFAFVPLWI